MTSIRKTLTLRLVAGIVVLVSAAGLLGHRVIESWLTRRFDESLLAKAEALAAGVESEVFGVGFQIQDRVLREFGREEEPAYFIVIDGNGRIVARSRSLASSAWNPGALGEGLSSVADTALPDGRQGRVIRARLPIPASEARPIPGHDALLSEARAKIGIASVTHLDFLVARGREEIDRAMATFTSGLLVAGLLLGASTALLVAWTVAKSCRPLRDVGRHIASLEPRGAMDGNWPVALPLELAPVRQGFERFAAGIHAAIARERRLTANLAHELRTPVAELRTAADLARSWPDDQGLRSRAVDEAHATALRLERTLGACIRLARIESREEHAEARLADVSALLREVIAAADGSAGRLETTIEDGEVAVTDAALLEILLRNLVDNAMQHAPASTPIRVGLSRVDDRVRITVANEAGGLGPGDLAHLEEPFWRRDEARSGSSHLGLGLTIAHAAARAIGTALRISLEGSRFVAVVELPAGAPDGGDPEVLD